jgi:hypothetical protein
LDYSLKRRGPSKAQLDGGLRQTTGGTAHPSREAHQTGSILAEGTTDVPLAVIASTKAGGGPGKSRIDFCPATLITSEAAHEGHIIAVRIEPLQSGGITIHEIALRRHQLRLRLSRRRVCRHTALLAE